ncbi:LOW QUALITY PROTEIN: hypothetical protein PHMEG_00022847 [Phytophthora megakarya]|uniref:ZSWIM1/3 RNaseH-like domain-containing protein n=1 Tax=Phytophthora megakarya TaxID=4795 RepID=A0A225VJ38_9STRA|nr:LOW QUALITY PROTEIN: hypothetical protein PHMEG_00022847 [Phytophthora megakarya]
MRTEVSIPTKRDTIDPDLLVPTEEYVADGLAPFHEDWTAWETYRRKYETRTFTILLIRESENVKKRNNQLAHSKNASECYIFLMIYLVGENTTFVLTVGEENLVGPELKFRGNSCPFRFMADNAFRGGKWCVEIRFPVYKHSHLVSQSQFDNYSQNRQIPLCELILDDVRLMIRVGRKSLRIYDYIRNHSKYKATIKDVYNLMSRIRGEISGEASDDVAVAAFLLAFNEADPDNVFSVDESDSGDTGTNFLDHIAHAPNFQAFTALLMIDCKHKNNSLMIMDLFGAGQFVQHSVIEINSDWHLCKVIDHFKSANPTWDNIRVVMVDKDMKEVDVEFPNAHVLLCHFHVLKFLQGIVKDSKYGKYS